MPTVINNNNIRDLVQKYLTNKYQLPDDLKDVPIGSWNVTNVTSMTDLFSFVDLSNFNEPLDGWDVSSVRDMDGMFNGCINFNQPLTSWDVSGVRHMDGMFNGCINFNQPLTSWNVSNVKDMTSIFNACINFNQPLTSWDVSGVRHMAYMFANCRNFNQPLNSWDVSNVRDMRYMFRNCTNFDQPLTSWNVSSVNNIDRMFENCGISQENKPIFNQPVEVDPLQVHKEASKINYSKLNSFLKEKLNNVVIPEGINYASFINETITNLINETDNTEKTKVQQRNDLGRIMSEILTGLNYEERTMLVRESIFYTLNYVLTQPNTFKQMYLQTFIQDCIHAYEGAAGMTCANGALERIVFSLVPACATEETNPDYETIIAIITANPSVLIPIYIRDWYRLHKTGTENAFPPGTTEEEMKSNLKAYLLEIFPNESKLIDKKIAEYADNIGYDEESFMYGGKKRKLKKTNTKKTKKTNTKKTKKTNTKKTKKTNKMKTKKTNTKQIK